MRKHRDIDARLVAKIAEMKHNRTSKQSLFEVMDSEKTSNPFRLYHP